MIERCTSIRICLVPEQRNNLPNRQRHDLPKQIFEWLYLIFKYHFQNVFPSLVWTKEKLKIPRLYIIRFFIFPDHFSKFPDFPDLEKKKKTSLTFPWPVGTLQILCSNFWHKHSQVILPLCQIIPYFNNFKEIALCRVPRIHSSARPY